MDYYDYIDKYIYQPVGMLNSGSFELDHVVENLATGYFIIVLGNYSPPTASKVVRYIGKTLNLEVL